jgi:hypothetical protein
MKTLENSSNPNSLTVKVAQKMVDEFNNYKYALYDIQKKFDKFLTRRRGMRTQRTRRVTRRTNRRTTRRTRKHHGGSHGNTGYTFNQFTLNFRSTKTIYENEIFISVLENEFNTSTNPSAYYEDGGYDYNVVVNKTFDNSLTETSIKKIHKEGIKYLRNSQYPYYSNITGYTSGSANARYGSFDDYDVSGSLDPTGSYLAPYITTIALYDDDLNIVAVAKLPQPIKSLHDYPLNFIIRFDS